MEIKRHKKYLLPVTILFANLILQGRTQECDTPLYSMSECLMTQNMTRTGMRLNHNEYIAYLFWPSNSSCGDTDPQILAPITGIPCQIECNDGEYLQIDTKARTYICTYCAENYYSNGGGFSVDGQFGEWQTALQPYSLLTKYSGLELKCFIYYCKISHKILLEAQGSLGSAKIAQSAHLHSKVFLCSVVRLQLKTLPQHLR